MRWCRVAIVALLLLASCHHDRRKQPLDTAQTDKSVPSVEDSSQMVDTDIIADKHLPEKPEVHAMKLDSAETTNLRIRVRKHRTIYNPSSLVGVWRRDSEHEEFMTDGRGLHWDTNDDVSHEEAQPFLWTMDSNLLVLEFHLEMGAVFYRQYVVTFVDDETLVYRDKFDKSYMWDKVLSASKDNIK